MKEVVVTKKMNGNVTVMVVIFFIIGAWVLIKPNNIELLGIENHALSLSEKDAQRLGLELFGKGKLEESRKLLLPAAENGNAYSQLLVATSFYYDVNAADNFKSAYFWFSKNSQDPFSQYYLSLLYHFGYYVEKSSERAMYWQGKSAEQSFPVAQYNQAVMYINNLDYINAYVWASYASQNGYSRSSELIKEIEQKLTAMERCIAEQKYKTTKEDHLWNGSGNMRMNSLWNKVFKT
ncbi:tetratricopeptide repeat protein [Aeromonas jandaei]|uniref:tetratricopeptide repeat protein n=1 Tax=Aeromonas jandaei TaxID=650 RepID=UPI0039867AD8